MRLVPQRHGFLERLAGAGREVVSKHPLNFASQRQFLGREHDAVAKLDHPPIAKKHVLFEFGPLGRWWLDDLGTANGVWINRTHYHATRRVLEPGDIIRFTDDLNEDVVFRFGVEGWEARDAGLRAAIDEAPADAARWLVWADFLEEQADPLADRIRGVGPSPGDLGVGAGHGWEHGFIARGVLQRGGRLLASARTELEVLLGSPFSRWMRALHVDFVSYLIPERPEGRRRGLDGPATEEAEALHALELLDRERPAALSVLTFKLRFPPKRDRLRNAFSLLKQALPKLQSDFEALVQR